jgi:hypothetical protein
MSKRPRMSIGYIQTARMYRDKRYLRALGPLDGKDKDTLVVEVGQGEAGIAKQKVFSIRRASLRIFLGYARGQQLRAGWVVVTDAEGLQIFQSSDMEDLVRE